MTYHRFFCLSFSWCAVSTNFWRGSFFSRRNQCFRKFLTRNPPSELFRCSWISKFVLFSFPRLLFHCISFVTGCRSGYSGPLRAIGRSFGTSNRPSLQSCGHLAWSVFDQIESRCCSSFSCSYFLCLSFFQGQCYG